LAAYGDWWAGLAPGLEPAARPGGGDTAALGRIAAQGRGHWESVAQAMLDLHRRGGPEAAGPIAELARSRSL
jgi:hypothetical protein